MIELKLLLKFSSPFAFLNLALSGKVEMLVVLRVNVIETYNVSPQLIVPGPGKLPAAFLMIDTNVGLLLSIFQLALSKE